MKNGKPKVVVTGDVCFDWNIASTRPSKLHNLWKSDNEWGSISSEPGASCLLGALIQRVSENVDNKYEVKTLRTPPSPVDSYLNDNIDNLLNLWSGFPQTESVCNKAVWRISQFLGWQRKKTPDLYKNEDEKVRPFGAYRLLVIDDKRFGFRDENAEPLWPVLKEPDWIMTRMARPLCEGALWTKLSKYENRHIVVVTANDLRHMDVRIRKELSWESTAEDVQSAMKKIKPLMECKHVIVSFDAAGAILYSKGKPNNKWELIFDPNELEGFTHKNDQGRVHGYAYCLVASIAHQIATSSEDLKNDNTCENTLKKAIKAGITAMQLLHNEGFDASDVEVNYFEEGELKKSRYLKIKFPMDSIANCISEFDICKAEYRDVPLPVIDNAWKNWSVAKELISLNSDLGADYFKKLQDIVLNGPKSNVIKDIPLLRIGDKKEIFIVERKEIEELRSISILIDEYCRRSNSTKDSKPLNIAVFGAPGSGKSFMVKNIAKALKLPVLLEKIEFNISQFTSVDDLTGAFHQVSDACLAGKIPLVFFDEFDCSVGALEFWWLKYFLMPMQDGKFQEKQITHVLGQCIFVFAGGICSTFAKLNEKAEETTRKEQKISDFVSRLKGHVSIQGIDLVNSELPTKTDEDMIKIKRALMLHSYLQRHADNIMSRKDDRKIQKGVLNAFLNIESYKHGARSMESIVEMSRLAGEAEYRKSALPPKELLDLHVNGDKFLKHAEDEG